MTRLLHRITRSRFWRSIFRHGWPDNPLDRTLVMTSNLFLHLHPVKVSRLSLKATYTFGLGLITLILFISLTMSGFMLMFYYSPTVERAYPSILNMQTTIPYGQIMRNLHRWGAHLMVLAALLHMLRVFYTGAYKPPREFNWVLGVGLLVLTLGASFTGYLLPWDQLSYWAITIGSSILAYAPGLGPALQIFLLGGQEVGQEALTRFYALHVFGLPLALAVVASLHLWRVRKDGGLAVQSIASGNTVASESLGTVYAFPVVALIEILLTLGVSLALVLLSTWANAPLLEIANPYLTPDPAKAPWYFVGLQELLEYGHPSLMAVLAPGLAGLFLLILPYLDPQPLGAGLWFTSQRGKRIAAYSALYAIAAVFFFITLETYILPRQLMQERLPQFVSLIIIPGGLLAVLVILPTIVLWRFRPERREMLILLFTELLVFTAIFTLVGWFMRGSGFQLVLPWLAKVGLAHRV